MLANVFAMAVACCPLWHVVAGAGATTKRYTFSMLPGQSFASWPDDTRWHISTWNSTCVVKIDPRPDGACCPYATVTMMADGAACPVGERFRVPRGDDGEPWLPYPGKASPR